MDDNRTKFLPQVKTPLVFFALSLLILEGIIGVVVAKSQMDGAQQLNAVYAMSVIFLIVILLVGAITIWAPAHLIGFDAAHPQSCKCPKCGADVPIVPHPDEIARGMKRGNNADSIPGA